MLDNDFNDEFLSTDPAIHCIDPLRFLAKRELISCPWKIQK